MDIGKLRLHDTLVATKSTTLHRSNVEPTAVKAGECATVNKISITDWAIEVWVSIDGTQLGMIRPNDWRLWEKKDEHAG